jgi:ABC-2 type transport system ATP-binding protein
MGWTRVRRRRIDELLERFDLHGVRATRMAGFSRGMQQKVALARALLHEPAVLFLDEPTTGLDPLAARAVRELILGLRAARRSIVLCTHELDEAERLADSVATLSHGRVVACGATQALRTRASAETLVRVTLARPCSEMVAIAAAVAGVAEPRPESATILTYRASLPQQANPAVVAGLAAAGAAIVSVTCTTATLEEVYATMLSQAPVAGGGA